MNAPLTPLTPLTCPDCEAPVALVEGRWSRHRTPDARGPKARTAPWCPLGGAPVETATLDAVAARRGWLHQADAAALALFEAEDAVEAVTRARRRGRPALPESVLVATRAHRDRARSAFLNLPAAAPQPPRSAR